MSVVLRLDHGAGRLILPLNRRARIRDRIADEIERLVDMLDALDGDTDAEPSLGWPDQIANFASCANDDREPILGWTDAVDQDGAARFGDAWHCDEEELLG